MANFTLTDEVRTVLERSKIHGNLLVLPPVQLDRALYEQVNKALVNAGGKWVTKLKGHLFDGDPASKIGLMLQTGVAVDEKKKFQAFYTPREIADQMAELADVRGHTVLEPSAGNGALANACMRKGATAVQCIELNPEAVAELGRKIYELEPVCADFLTQKPSAPYRRIVMNPPFTKGQDLKHLAHALTWLHRDGFLVSLVQGNKQLQLEKLLGGYQWGDPRFAAMVV